MMHKYTSVLLFISCFLIFGSLQVTAQRKSDLIQEIDTLKEQLREVRNELATAEKNVKVSEAKAASFEAQVSELQDANATLLKNLNNFAEVSNKNTSAVNQALGSLAEKENQLKFITETFSRNDSTAIVLLTNAKKTLGENANVKVGNNGMSITAKLTDLFTEETNSTLQEEALPWLEKVAEILKNNKGSFLQIDGLSMTGNIALAARQATETMVVLNEKFEVPFERMAAAGKDGNFSEGVQFNIVPDFRKFYIEVKSQLKNQ